LKIPGFLVIPGLDPKSDLPARCSVGDYTPNTTTTKFLTERRVAHLLKFTGIYGGIYRRDFIRTRGNDPLHDQLVIGAYVGFKLMGFSEPEGRLLKPPWALACKFVGLTLDTKDGKTFTGTRYDQQLHRKGNKIARAAVEVYKVMPARLYSLTECTKVVWKLIVLYGLHLDKKIRHLKNK
jgi:hypothetical protein